MRNWRYRLVYLVVLGCFVGFYFSVSAADAAKGGNKITVLLPFVTLAAAGVSAWFGLMWADRARKFFCSRCNLRCETIPVGSGTVDRAPGARCPSCGALSSLRLVGRKPSADNPLYEVV